MSKKDKTTEEALQKFSNCLHNKGLNLTQARQIVFDEVFSIHRHFDAHELVEKLHDGANRVARGTIYRTLDLLEKINLIRKTYEGERRLHYEHVYGHSHHDHLLCESCGKIIEFFEQDISDSMKRVCKRNKFKERTHTLQIVGICKECRKKKGDRERK